MDAFVSYLQSIGPFTTPLCVAMATAIWWFDRERNRLLGRLDEALVDARGLRERRADDLAESVRDYQAHTLALREALDRLTASVRGVGRGQDA